MALIDLNGDGVIDLVLSGTASNGASGIGVCFGNGDGTFQLPVFYQAGNDYLINDLVMGDFNGDGIPDVAITGASGIWLFLGQEGGVFSLAGCGKTQFSYWQAEQFSVELSYAWRRSPASGDVQLFVPGTTCTDRSSFTADSAVGRSGVEFVCRRVSTPCTRQSDVGQWRPRS